MQQEFQPLVFKRLLQHLAGDFVELTLKQPRPEVHDSHIHAAQLQAVGGFEAEQAAADHHRVLVQLGGFDHLVGILDVAITDDAGQVVAGNRQHEWGRTGGNQQAVVFLFRAVFGDDLALDAVDLGDLLAGMQLDALFLVPIQFVEHDLGNGHFASQHR